MIIDTFIYVNMSAVTCDTKVVELFISKRFDDRSGATCYNAWMSGAAAVVWSLQCHEERKNITFRSRLVDTSVKKSTNRNWKEGLSSGKKLISIIPQPRVLYSYKCLERSLPWAVECFIERFSVQCNPFWPCFGWSHGYAVNLWCKLRYLFQTGFSELE